MGATSALTVATLPHDWQVTPPEVRRAYAVTDLIPTVAPLTVYEQLPVPEGVPAGSPVHVKVDPSEPVAVNITLVFLHTITVDAVIFGLLGNSCDKAITVAMSEWQVTPPAVTCEYTVTVFPPVMEALNENEEPLGVPV
jgi:hypothetical protein